MTHTEYDITDTDLDDIARMTHVVNGALKEVNHEDEQPTWDDAPEWMRADSRKSVRRIANGEVTEWAQEHNEWAAGKRADGWTYGPVRDNDRKIHPLLVPAHDLEPIQAAKDAVRFAIVSEMLAQLARRRG